MTPHLMLTLGILAVALAAAAFVEAASPARARESLSPRRLPPSRASVRDRETRLKVAALEQTLRFSSPERRRVISTMGGVAWLAPRAVRPAGD